MDTTTYETTIRTEPAVRVAALRHDGDYQAIGSTFERLMALAVGHFLDRFPVATMREGDCYLTNDPWKGTGHLNDFTVVSPAYRKGRLVALFASTSHMVDIGGIGMSPDGRQVYHEGLFVPIMPFATAGVEPERRRRAADHGDSVPPQLILHHQGLATDDVVHPGE